MFKTSKIAVLALYLTSAAFGNTELTPSQAYVAQRLGQLKVHHHKNDFYVEDNSTVHKVQRCFVDKEVRGASKENLAKFLACGKVSVNRCGENEFSIKAQPRLVGGGGGGSIAGMWIGRFAGYGLVYGGSALVLSPLAFIPGVGPGVYATTVQVAWATLAPVAETAATIGAISGAITGGVATGPV